MAFHDDFLRPSRYDYEPQHRLFKIWQYCTDDHPFDEEFKHLISVAQNERVAFPDLVLRAVAEGAEVDDGAVVNELEAFAVAELNKIVPDFAADIDDLQRKVPGTQLTRDDIDIQLVDGINAAHLKNLQAPTTLAQLQDSGWMLPFIARDDVVLIGEGHPAPYVTWVEDVWKKEEVRRGGPGGPPSIPRHGFIMVASKGSGLDPGVLSLSGCSRTVDHDALETALRRISKKEILHNMMELQKWSSKKFGTRKAFANR
jgi:hypothetical protein